MVEVNGKVLSKSKGAEPCPIQNEWGADTAGNRLIICIPRYDVEQSDAVAEIEVYLSRG
jgi:hypothetical protein